MDTINDLRRAHPFRAFRINSGGQSALVLHPDYVFVSPADRTVAIVAKPKGGFMLFNPEFSNIEVLSEADALSLTRQLVTES